MQAERAQPLVSVVTLNYNGLRFLKALFDSLQNCTYDNLEIIMVDNCSDDDSVAFVREHYPQVRVIENPQNYMYARGNNIGLAEAAGKYICLMNNDVDVDPGFIEPIVEAFEQDPTIGGAQPKILAMQQRDYLEYAGACGGFVDWLGYPFLRGRVFFTTEKDEGQYDQQEELFWASGACLFLRREMLAETGMLDEDFIIHMEEIDLCWRMRLMGWRILSIPQARVWHHVGGTLDQNNPRKTYWNFRNNMFLLMKNFGAGRLILRLIFRLPLDLLAFASEFLKGHFRNAYAVASAYGWVCTHLPLILGKRRAVQRMRLRSDGHIMKRVYPGSIVLEYFLLKRKRFSDLMFVDRLWTTRPGSGPDNARSNRSRTISAAK